MFMDRENESKDDAVDVIKNLIESINSAKSSYVKASSSEEKEKIRNEIENLETQINKFDQKYKFDWSALLRAEEKQKKGEEYQTNWKSKMPKEKLGSFVDDKRLKVWVDMLPKLDGAKKDVADLLKAIESVKTSVADYKKDIGRSRRRTLLTIVVVGLLTGVALGSYFHFSSKGLREELKKRQEEKIKHREEVAGYKKETKRLREAQEEANRDLPEKISYAIAPHQEEIGCLYEMIDEEKSKLEKLTEKYEGVAASTTILEGKVTSAEGAYKILKEEVESDKTKYAILSDEVVKLEEKLTALDKKSTGRKEYDDDKKMIEERLLNIKKRVDELSGKNYSP